MFISSRQIALATMFALAAPALASRSARAQDGGAQGAAQGAPPESRTAIIEQAQAEKSANLTEFKPGKVEEFLNGMEQAMLLGSRRVHPFFDSAYAGGGFTIGAGYAKYVSPYSFVDLRGSITGKGYARIEAALISPRVFDRRGTLTVIGGWRKATQVGYYGTGMQTSVQDRTNYSFTQPYGSADLDFLPTRKFFVLHGGAELSRWNLGSGKGDVPSVETIYTPETLPGLGTSTTYFHTEGGVALDSRRAPDYARRGGFYGVTLHDFHDTSNAFGFRRTDYEAIQHIPILRETWVISLHGRVQLAEAAHDQTIPFFMLPSLGGGSSLRAYNSWRFRDRNSLLLQAEWRVIANRFLDLALGYDAGRVASRRSDLTTSPLKSDYGIGIRFHGQLATPLRVELFNGSEGLNVVFAAKASF
jgi:hypothetical protein